MLFSTGRIFPGQIPNPIHLLSDREIYLRNFLLESVGLQELPDERIFEHALADATGPGTVTATQVSVHRMGRYTFQMSLPTTSIRRPTKSTNVLSVFFFFTYRKHLDIN